MEVLITLYHEKKKGDAVLLYVFNIGFPASPFDSIVKREMGNTILNTYSAKLLFSLFSTVQCSADLLNVQSVTPACDM